MRRSLRRAMGAYAVAAVVVATPLAPAFADTTVTVRGTSFTSGRAAQLSLVGCADPYRRVSEDLQPYIGIGPEQAPAGLRSLGYDLAGGNAIGSLHYVDSVRATTVAGMSVYAQEGVSGVSYIGYQAPADRGTGRVWFGRAELSVPAASWTDVEVAPRTFTWHRYDMVAMRALDGAAADGGSASVADFVAAHGGDGPGFVTIGFGCDGKPFSMDAWRVGAPGSVTTYDLEGLATTTSMAGPTEPVRPGTPVRLHGTVTVVGGDLGAARLVLERRQPDGSWSIVDGVDATTGQPAEVTVTPDATTTYRWELVDRPLAEGSTSAPLTVSVRRAAEPSASASSSPSATPSSTPSGTPSATPSSSPSSPRPTDRATPTSSPSASRSPSPSSSASTAASASGSASASPTRLPSAGLSTTPSASATVTVTGSVTSGPSSPTP